MATVVKKKPDESDDRLIARFRRKVQAEQILIDLKDREFYKKPSVVKKEKRKQRGSKRTKRR